MAHALFDIARKLNLYFRVSRNGSKVFTFVNTDNSAYSLSGTDLRLRIKAAKGASDNVLELTTSSGLTVSTNTLTVAITDTQSAIPEKMYYWELYDATSKKTWLFGNAYFTTGYPTEETETTSVTVSLDPDTVRITISGGGTSGATNLDGLTDVTITSAATGQYLRYNGSAWVNSNTMDGGTV